MLCKNVTHVGVGGIPILTSTRGTSSPTLWQQALQTLLLELIISLSKSATGKSSRKLRSHTSHEVPNRDHAIYCASRSQAGSRCIPPC